MNAIRRLLVRWLMPEIRIYTPSSENLDIIARHVHRELIRSSARAGKTLS